jgi:hypothetical protein
MRSSTLRLTQVECKLTPPYDRLPFLQCGGDCKHETFLRCHSRSVEGLHHPHDISPGYYLSLEGKKLLLGFVFIQQLIFIPLALTCRTILL